MLSLWPLFVTGVIATFQLAYFQTLSQLERYLLSSGLFREAQFLSVREDQNGR